MQVLNKVEGTIDVPIAVPTYAGQAPRLDGKVSESAWVGACKISDFLVRGSGELASQRTEVRICYDRSTLYLAFECFESKTDQLVAKQSVDGDPVWNDDSVEIFISPNSVADVGNCHQFAVSVTGAKTHVQPGWERRSENWRAAVSTMKDRWIAEIAIPFDTLRPLGRNESCWRVNLCRNDNHYGEMASWSFVPRWYATYSRFGKLVAPEAAFKFCTYRGEPVRLQADASAPSGCEPVSEHAPALRSDDYIIPEPQEVHNRRSKEPFRITADTRIVVDDDAAEADLWTADEINAAIQQLGGQRLAVVRSLAVGDDPERAADVIIVGESARNPLLRAVCEHDTVRLPRARYGTGAYAIDVLPQRIVISGSSVENTFYGAQTLKQLFRMDADGSISVSAVTVRDSARFTYRGVHLLTSRDSLAYISKLIENVLAPLKVNNIVLQTDRIDWASHPEIVDRRNCMPREDIAKLLEVARRHHITVTPLVQCPGHLEYALRDPKNRGLAEDPDHPYCYCMSNPKSYEFIFSLIDEAIELFGHPEYVHAGHDEFDMLGTMPYDAQCKTVGKEKLYVQDTLRIYEHLKSKGCKMMIWGDVLSKTEYRGLVDQLPKDILINDWRYAPAAEYPTVAFYQSHGFGVVGGTWYNPRNILTFSGYAAQRGIDGMLQTTWTGWKTEEETLRDHPDQVYAYILGAAWAWNPMRPTLDELPYRPDTVFQKLWHPSLATPGPAFSIVRLDSHCNISRIDSGRSIGWLGLGRGNDLRAMPEGLVVMEATPYMVLPAKLESPSVIMLGGRAMPASFPLRIDGIEVNATLTALNFLHGCAHSAGPDAKVGSYIVHYEDGKTSQIDLLYSRNISAWNDQSSAMSYGFAWRGKAQDGRLVGVCDLRWKNPRPDVRVTAIDFLAEDTEASPFLVALTAER
jgi:hexosaminidase